MKILGCLAVSQCCAAPMVAPKGQFPLVLRTVLVCSYDVIGTQFCDYHAYSAFTVRRFVDEFLVARRDMTHRQPKSFAPPCQSLANAPKCGARRNDPYRTWSAPRARPMQPCSATEFNRVDEHDEAIALFITVIGGQRYPDTYKWSGVHFCIRSATVFLFLNWNRRF